MREPSPVAKNVIGSLGFLFVLLLSLAPMLVVVGVSVVSGANCLPQANCTLAPMPDSEGIADGGTITANACGGLKRITTPGAFTTSTVDTFSPPSNENKNCFMVVCNMGLNTLILDQNSHFFATAATISLTEHDCISVISSGTAWFQVAPVAVNTN